MDEQVPTDVLTITDDIELDDDALESLGEKKVQTTLYHLHPILKNRWEKIVTEGLEKEERATLLKKQEFPANLPSLEAPILNLEILSALPEQTTKMTNSKLADKPS